MLANATCFRLPLAAGSVHTCVTSPPYWGLRKYAGNQGEAPLGLEPTPEEHIARTVEWCREVWRVLRDDGVFWLNYGDAYDGGNLLLMPHRIAIALQADGWTVRNDVVWAKKNPMPESAAGWRWEGDKLKRGSWRHTRAHEYVFMLTKGMGYFSDQEAVREAESAETSARYKYGFAPVWTEEKGNADPAGGGYRGDSSSTRKSGRNPRSVMHLATSPYKGAHFATYPPNLIRPLILSSCPAKCCSVCGAGWAPVVEKSGAVKNADYASEARSSVQEGGMATTTLNGTPPAVAVLGYRPTCEHDAPSVPGIVLDPFVGSGTTAVVAHELGRRWVGFDISEPYLREQAAPRIAKVAVGLGL